MLRILVATFILALLGVSETAFADYNWTWTVGCPESGATSPASTFSATTNTTWSFSGTCQRTETNFTMFDVTTNNQPAPNFTQFFGMTSGNFLLVPPVLPYETKPVVILTAACPTVNKSVSWIIFQWKDDTRMTLDTINLFGRATWDTSTGLQLDNAYDVTGALNLTGPVAMTGTACSGGSFSLTGAGDRGGTMYMTAPGAGYYKTITEKSFFFIPQYTLSAAADLGSLTFQGLAFDSTDYTTSVAYRVTSNAAGTTWTLEPYSSVLNNTIDSSYTDTITISAVNSPFNGAMVGSLTRTGVGAGTGRVACIANKSVSTRVLCVAESPADNTIPYGIAFGIDGPHVIGQASGTSTTGNGGINVSEGVYSDGTRLFLADSSNNRVLIWNSIPNNDQISPDLVLGQPDMSSSAANNGGRTAASLSTPRSVYSDGTKLYVADTSNNRILIWNTMPTANKQAADLVLGQPSMTAGTANNPSRAATTLSAPYSVVGDGTNLYVADSNNHRILIWTTLPATNQAAANLVLGQTAMTLASSGTAANQLDTPKDARSDGSKLFVSDSANNRVLIWNTIPATNNVSADRVLGQTTMTGNRANDGGRTGSTLSGVRGIHSNGSKLYVADTSNNRVLIWSTIPTTNAQVADLVLGQTTMTSGTANNGGLGANTLSSPRSVITTGSKLFVADTLNYRVLMWDPLPIGNKESADKVQAQPNFTVNSANSDLLNAQALNTPNHAMTDGTKYYVADTSNNRVLIFNTIPTGDYANADVVLGQPSMGSNTANNGGVGSQSLSAPEAVHSDGTKLYVADSGNNRVLIWNTIPTVNQTAASVVVGQPNMTTVSANNTQKKHDAPSFVSTSGTKMFVADSGNNRVLIYDTIPVANNADATWVVGQPDMTTVTASTSTTKMRAPNAVVSDGTKLYVADTSSHRVVIWNTVPTSNGAAANVVLGQPDMTSRTADNGGLSASSLDTPMGISVSNSKLYVSDNGNNRVLVWTTIPTANQTAASLAYGQPNSTSATANNGGVSSNRMSSPIHVSADASKFFVADSVNRRILSFEAP
jgi:hypothetical protein